MPHFGAGGTLAPARLLGLTGAWSCGRLCIGSRLLCAWAERPSRCIRGGAGDPGSLWRVPGGEMAGQTLGILEQGPAITAGGASPFESLLLACR